MSALIISPPITKYLPPHLNFLAFPISNYFSAVPPYNNVLLEAMIFTPPPRPPRILLLQSAGGGADPNAFSDFWQVPSGKPITEDETLLHTLARIVWEQTGLRLSYVGAMAGTEEGSETMQTGYGCQMKMLFMVEVVELDPRFRQTPLSSEMYSIPRSSDSEASEAGFDEEADLDSVNVRIDPEKHRLHAWATESDLRDFLGAGLYPVEEKAQYQIMLEAFAYYKHDFAQLDYLRQTRSSSSQGQTHGFPLM